MPGTPTANLALTVPTVNGEAGIWGTELNGNLAILDAAAAIAFVTVTTTGTLTLPAVPVSVFRVTTGNSNLTSTLPTPGVVTFYREIVIKKVDSGTGYVIISGSIDGFTSYELTNQYQYVRLAWNGSTWDVIGGN